MLVWAELPSWSDCWFPSDHFSYTAAQRVERMFAEMMMRDWNHPCLGIQTIMNESWGINLKAEEQRAWLKSTFDKMKAVLQPLGRLVIDNSACEGNFHLKSDIEDFHNYYSQPDQSDLWDNFISEFSSRAAWTYSPFGDAERTGREPLVVSEFGNWGLPQLPPELPWWFSHSFGEREVTRPGGVLQRFLDYKLDRIFGSFEELATETQWHQFASLKYEIESMRRQPELQGYCVTGMTDVHWEVNGLLDMWRNEKAFAEDLRRIQQLDLILGAVPKDNFYGGEAVEVPVLLSHFSEKEAAGARVHWSMQSGDAGELEIADRIPRGTVREIGRILTRVPEVQRASRLQLRIELRGRNGALWGENSYPLFAFPKAAPIARALAVHDPAGTASAALRAMREAGCELTAFDGSQRPCRELVLSSALDEAVLRHLEAGGRALVLADSEQAFPAERQLSCIQRAGNWLDGRWFSNYNWVDPQAPPYRELLFSRILGFESRHVVPQFVIGNVGPEQFDAVIAGITLGWIQLNHPLALMIGAGSGRALLTTFRFPKYGIDPYSTHLLNAYVAHALSDEAESVLGVGKNAVAKS
jgi:hypothetical protein